MYLIIPFGGAVVIVEGTLHVVHMFQRSTHDDQNNTLATNDSIADFEHKTTRESELSQPEVHVESDPDDGSALAMDLLPSDTESTISIPPKTTDEAARQILSQRTETFSLVLILGLMLMALIHAPSFRKFALGMAAKALRFAKTVLFETPMLLLKLPVLLNLWNSTFFVRIRRYVITPTILAIFLGRALPWLVGGRELAWWWVGGIGILASGMLNTRLGRDAQELTRDWVEDAVHQLQARLLFAFIGWVVDFFRFLLSTMERVLYAVDEWLRFHSDENWFSIFAKAILGVVWSFVSFLIRIYVNLLIEPTFHPVKHFPVVTVAHKIFLPALIMLEGNMVHFLGQYLGTPLARSFTWFNMLFLPGFFGFAVWELKENWKLYSANRADRLRPVPVGSHGETIARLLRPGFHSGTLPKIFRKLRRLEQKDASLGRFTNRRSTREQLHHVEQSIQSFVERELISLLEKCQTWANTPLRCLRVEAASNSFSIELECLTQRGETSLIRVQEQSGWILASTSRLGWLDSISIEHRNSFLNALEGFYRKCGIELVREQIESNLTGTDPYDIDARGLVVWPNSQFDFEVIVDLKVDGAIVSQSANGAAAVNLLPIQSERVVFSASHTQRQTWENMWSIKELANTRHELQATLARFNNS